MSLADDRRKDIKYAIQNAYNLIQENAKEYSKETCYIKDGSLIFTRAGILTFPKGNIVYRCIDYGVKAGFIEVKEKIKNKLWYSYTPELE